jgi:hypothetical protein
MFQFFRNMLQDDGGVRVELVLGQVAAASVKSRLSAGFKVQKPTGLESAAGKAFGALEPGVAAKVSCRGANEATIF